MKNIIIPIYSFTKAGGGRVLSKLADYFIDSGFHVTFVVPVHNSAPYYPTKARVIPVESKVTRWHSVNVILGLYSVWRLVRKMSASYVLASHYVSAYLVALLPSAFRKYYYVQAYEVKLASSTLGKVFAFFSYWLPLKKIVNSSHILPSFIPSVIGTVPAGMDLDLYCTESKSYGLSRTIVVGCIGRQEPHKGTVEIVKAFEALSKKYNLKLNIAVYKPDIPGAIADKVEHFPISSDAELADFYRSCDVVVATGLVENKAFHYPCAEGMAANKIVVSNYAPLAVKDRVLHPALILETVCADSIIASLEYAINMDVEQQLAETSDNMEVVRAYAWDNVGSDFLDLLLRS